MKRSPFGATSVWPVRLMLTPMRACCTEATNTFCTLLESPDTDSTKNTRSLLPVSPNTPGLTRDTSSRACTRDWYCSPICAAQGEMNSDRSEEHTSELQSRLHLVCRLLLEKKK